VNPLPCLRRSGYAQAGARGGESFCCYFLFNGGSKMAKLMIKNIGTLVSGNISNPVLNADTLMIEGGLIQEE
jgi:hypothetical protein